MIEWHIDIEGVDVEVQLLTPDAVTEAEIRFDCLVMFPNQKVLAVRKGTETVYTAEQSRLFDTGEPTPPIENWVRCPDCGTLFDAEEN